MFGGKILDDLVRVAYRDEVPLLVNFELTHQCNERCKHCYIDFSTLPPLPKQFWFRCLDELADLGSLILTISGGEPLMHPDFEEIYSYAHTGGFGIRLFSNLLLMDNQILDLLIKYKPLNVQTSLYGHSAELHDSITNTPGSFEKTTNAVRRLVDAGIPVVAKSSWLQENIGYFIEVEKLAYDLGAEFSATVRTMPARNGDESNTQLRPTRQQLVEIYSATQDSPRDEKFKRAASGSDKLREFSGTEPIKGDHPCGAAVVTLRIGANGEVFPCVQFNTPGGDATTMSLKQIWNESDWFKQLRSLRQSDAKECKSCSLKKSCFRCPADAYFDTGDPLGCSVEAKEVTLAYIESKSGKQVVGSYAELEHDF